MSGHVIHHMQGPIKFSESNAPYLCGAVDGSATTRSTAPSVTCADCLNILAGKQVVSVPEHFLRNHPGGGISYLCGVTRAAAASVDPKHVTCEDCLTIMRGSGVRPHTPPNMNDDDDGVFTFHSHDRDFGGDMEVVPMTTGNVEFTVGKSVFSLHHLDRADLIRALLHDFHYSPERFGPNDE